MGSPCHGPAAARTGISGAGLWGPGGAYGPGRTGGAGRAGGADAQAVRVVRVGRPHGPGGGVRAVQAGRAVRVGRGP
ncbi:hypothetical protein [Streptomyces sp. NRRL F-2664]|uniref:hypothetical protein n=1 Tax=Streptomyces sp. NRRL F-2664 TaxID=1463842 RepID=UPI000AB193A7|nr:hypothetical protein [Streptomyces sp. NRRL F-2664]